MRLNTYCGILCLLLVGDLVEGNVIFNMVRDALIMH